MGKCKMPVILGGGKNTGLYVWNKFKYAYSTKGDWVDYVVSDNNSEYPNGAVHTDGYWYELSTANLTVKTGYVNSTGSVDVNTQLGKVPKYYGISNLNMTIGVDSTLSQSTYECFVSVTSSGDVISVSFSKDRYGDYELKSASFDWFAIG